jgi:hypothetical protein
MEAPEFTTIPRVFTGKKRSWLQKPCRFTMQVGDAIRVRKGGGAFEYVPQDEERRPPQKFEKGYHCVDLPTFNRIKAHPHIVRKSHRVNAYISHWYYVYVGANP